MASSVAGGLAFATVLTLLLTPSLLMIQANGSRRWREFRATPPRAGRPWKALANPCKTGIL